MQKIVVRDGILFEYTLKRSVRSRTIRLIVHASGSIQVTAPYQVSELKVEHFVIEKAHWILRTIEHCKKNKRAELDVDRGVNWQVHKEVAYERISKRLDYFNQFYHFTWNAVTIKKIKSRWGSCSSKGNLNFSYKLALLSPELADYIIVHELCHLKEMNHSKNFWELVAKTIPDYKALRKQLKTIF